MSDNPDATVAEVKAVEALGNQRIDYFVSAVKAAAGAVPIVGNAVAEVVTLVIPKQRIDRVADLVRELATKIEDARADIDKLMDRFKSEQFTDLFEETVLQAGRALSEERRKYLANLLFKGLTDEELEHARVKKLLFILDDLLDQEIIWLTYLNLGIGEDADEFLETHQHVLQSVTATIGSTQTELDQSALQEAYQHRLEQLGLVENADAVTPLGRLLLRYIDAPGASEESESEET